MPFDCQLDPYRGHQLAFDFDRAAVPSRSVAARQRTNYHAGLNAERLVCRHYLRNGARFVEHRWRGPGGEIDLILAEGDRIVFVEVKKSKTHDAAILRVSARQLARICASAESYLGSCAKGALTEMRIDVALVDARGAVEIVKNANLAA